MNIGSLSTGQTPPLSVPLPYFIAAPIFLAAAGVLLLFYPDALATRWSPYALAVTHLVTLGFLAMAMMGALQQVLPVLLGERLRRPRAVAWVTWGALGAGTAVLVVGFIDGPFWTRIAVPLLMTAVVLLAVAAMPAIWRSPVRNATRQALLLALAGLLVTAGLGAYLAAGWGWTAVPLARHLTGLHLGWGLLGWVGLLVAGMAYQVVPMFQVAPDYPRWLMRWLGPLLVLGLAVWTLALLTGLPGRLPEVLLAAGLVVFAGCTVMIQQRRRRRLPDVTVDFWRLGMASLAGAAVLGLWPGIPPMLIGTLFVFGFAVSVVNGMLYKVIPFLVWLHMNNRLQAAGQSQHGVPNMKQIIHARAARLQFRIHSLTLAAAGGACAGLPWLGGPAGVLLGASALLLLWNVVGALHLYRRSVAPL